VSDVDISFYDEKHFNSRCNQFSKKHEDEVSQTLTNFFRAIDFFREANVEQLRRSGLVRPESHGVLAVDQKGSRTRPPHQVRLYFYPWEDDVGKHVKILTMGDKARQQEDNNRCAEFLEKAGLK